MEKINCWVLLGYRPHVLEPRIYWTKSKYFSNGIKDKDNNKYILDNIIYREDYDSYDDVNNPIYEDISSACNVNSEDRLMMIIKNGTDMDSSEIYRMEQNKIEDYKDYLYNKSLGDPDPINPDGTKHNICKRI